MASLVKGDVDWTLVEQVTEEGDAQVPGWMAPYKDFATYREKVNYISQVAGIHVGLGVVTCGDTFVGFVEGCGWRTFPCRKKAEALEAAAERWIESIPIVDGTWVMKTTPMASDADDIEDNAEMVFPNPYSDCADFVPPSSTLRGVTAVVMEMTDFLNLPDIWLISGDEKTGRVLHPEVRFILYGSFKPWRHVINVELPAALRGKVFIMPDYDPTVSRVVLASTLVEMECDVHLCTSLSDGEPELTMARSPLSSTALLTGASLVPLTPFSILKSYTYGVAPGEACCHAMIEATLPRMLDAASARREQGPDLTLPLNFVVDRLIDSVQHPGSGLTRDLVLQLITGGGTRLSVNVSTGQVSLPPCLAPSVCVADLGCLAELVPWVLKSLGA